MEELSLVDYLTILKRWKKSFFTAFLVTFAVCTVFTLGWSNYRSVATVEVEQPQVAPVMTAPTGVSASDMPEALADLSIGKIQQKITAPASLVDIINKYDLYPHSRDFTPIEVVAKRMADKIKLNLMSSTIANPAATQKVSLDQLSATAFTLSFDYSDPQIARAVNSELINRFLDEDLKQRRQDVVATSDFLDAQIKALEASLADQEKKIAEFESQHGISGPESLAFNQQAAANATMSLQSLDSQIATNEGSQGSLRAQLSSVDPYSRVIADGQMLTTPATELKALQAEYTTLTAHYGPEHPDVIKVRNQIKALQAESGISSGGNNNQTAALRSQIDDTKNNLAVAQKTYGSDNPDVIALQHKLAALNQELASTPIHSGRGIKSDADNPAYLAIISQLDSLESQHKSLLDQRKALSAQQEKYEQALIKNPGLEQQMAVLSRDHDNAEVRYREMKERKMAADMDVQMIEDHKGQHLTVISPPDLPQTTQPKRSLLFVGSVFLSLIAGFAVVIVAQILSQSIVGARHLTAIVGVPPLVVVPHIYTMEEKNQSADRIAARYLRSFAAGKKPAFTALPPKGDL